MDGLMQVAREVVGQEPSGGGVFIFHGRDRRRLKVLWLDGHGCCVLYRRLHGARFVLPQVDGATPAVLDVQQLTELLRGVRRVPAKAKRLMH
jgi:transposase